MTEVRAIPISTFCVLKPYEVGGETLYRVLPPNEEKENVQGDTKRALVRAVNNGCNVRFGMNIYEPIAVADEILLKPLG